MSKFTGNTFNITLSSACNRLQSGFYFKNMKNLRVIELSAIRADAVAAIVAVELKRLAGAAVEYVSCEPQEDKKEQD